MRKNTYQWRKKASNWLKKNTVLFGDPTQDGLHDVPAGSTGEAYTLSRRLAVAFAKKFPTDGYDHNARTYRGSEKYYMTALDGPGTSPYDHYLDFVQNPSLSNPAVSFFGASGFSGYSQIVLAVKVPIVTAWHTLRLLVEFLPFDSPAILGHLLLVESKLRWMDSVAKGDNLPARIGWGILSGLGIVAGTAVYYPAKLVGKAVRLVTAPHESMKSATHKRPKTAWASAALSTLLTAGVAAIVMLLQGAYHKVRNHFHRKSRKSKGHSVRLVQRRDSVDEESSQELDIERPKVKQEKPKKEKKQSADVHRSWAETDDQQSVVAMFTDTGSGTFQPNQNPSPKGQVVTKNDPDEIICIL